jgi:sec-independent protein translocase protein TatC
MASEEDKKGAHAPTGEGEPLSAPESTLSEGAQAEPVQEHPSVSGQPAGADPVEPEHPTGTQPGNSTVSYTPTVDDSYGSYDDPYGYDVHAPSTETLPAVQPAAPPPPPPPPPPEEEELDEDEEGMLRMSFLGHLEDLRKRLLYMLGGLGVAFVFCLTFCAELWKVVAQPAVAALKELKVDPPTLVQISPMDAFTIIWMKLPLLCSVFIASPWILYQIWAFVAPGLYKKERRFAAPFVITSAGLFIAGGAFAYFVAFRYGLTFLLGIGFSGGEGSVRPTISMVDYFDLFVNVMLGIGLVFELPILIFFLTFLRIASPKFLLSNSRYAILIIVIIAAIVTPTPDVFNLMLFAVPMVLLFFVGVFAGYVLTLHRENRRFPWGIFLAAVGIPLLLIGLGVYAAVTNYGYKLVLHWPFLVR